MAKATHNGTCQACGRKQAVNVKTGLLAKHGYVVDWGFHGVCSGADKIPAEHDLTHMVAVQAELDEMATHLETRKAEDIDAVLLAPKEDRFGPKEWFTEENINKARTYNRSWAELQEKERYLGEYKAKNIRQHVAYLTEEVAPVNGKELTAR
jgi:hypothetical protein